MRVTTLIPAYNEESRIEKVLNPVLNTSIVSHVIVIDDGSEDSTSKVVAKYGVDIIKLPYNQGKAAAVREGIAYCKNKCDIILLLDADLIGLKPKHIEALVLPILYKNIDMTVGIFKSGRYFTDLAQVIAPNLSGQRAIRSHIAYNILNMDITGYGIEVALSDLVKSYKLNLEYVTLENVSHVTKEEKVGIVKGTIWRAKMYKDIIKYWMH